MAQLDKLLIGLDPFIQSLKAFLACNSKSLKHSLLVTVSDVFLSD